MRPQYTQLLFYGLISLFIPIANFSLINPQAIVSPINIYLGVITLFFLFFAFKSIPEDQESVLIKHPWISLSVPVFSFTGALIFSDFFVNKNFLRTNGDVAVQVLYATKPTLGTRSAMPNKNRQTGNLPLTKLSSN